MKDRGSLNDRGSSMGRDVQKKKYVKGDETREKILRAAIDLFDQYGFARASTRQLVKQVGMSSSAIYNHFPDKDHVLFTIISGAGDNTLNTLRDVIDRYDDPEECLRNMIAGMLGLFKTGAMRKEIAIFIDELPQLPEDLREICNRQHRQIFDLFEMKVKELKKRNLANPINDKVATFGILGAMLWVYHWFRDTGPISIEQVAGELTHLLLHGLMKTDSPTQPVSEGDLQAGSTDE